METIPVQGAPHQTYVIPSSSRVYAAGADGLLQADPADVPVLVWLGCILAESVPETLPIEELADDTGGSDRVSGGKGNAPPAKRSR